MKAQVSRDKSSASAHRETKMVISEIEEPTAEMEVLDEAVVSLMVHEALRAMLQTVVHKRRVIGIPREDWIDAVLEKLNDVDVVTLRDFMRAVLVLNQRLSRARH
jgi:hypothetical protein